jgi:hypothetical protein
MHSPATNSNPFLHWHLSLMQAPPLQFCGAHLLLTSFFLPFSSLEKKQTFFKGNLILNLLTLLDSGEFGCDFCLFMLPFVLKFWRASLFALVTAQETVAIPTASSE